MTPWAQHPDPGPGQPTGVSQAATRLRQHLAEHLPEWSEGPGYHDIEIGLWTILQPELTVLWGFPDTHESQVHHTEQDAWELLADPVERKKVEDALSGVNAYVNFYQLARNFEPWDRELQHSKLLLKVCRFLGLLRPLLDALAKSGS